MDKAERDAWFVAEVLPLEGELTRFFRQRWRSADDVADLRQELYARLYEAVGRAGPPRSVRAFAITTARNLMIDRLRRDQVVSIDFVADLESVGSKPDLSAEERQATARLEVSRLKSALETLPPRCREVIRMRKIEQCSQKDVAERLGITQDTVEHHVARGVRLLADQLFGASDSAPVRASKGKVRVRNAD